MKTTIDSCIKKILSDLSVSKITCTRVVSGVVEKFG